MLNHQGKQYLNGTLNVLGGMKDSEIIDSFYLHSLNIKSIV